MPLIEWRDEYKIGIPSVDYEHESLVRLLNDLYANLGEKGGKEAVSDFLAEVHARIAAHFALEETIMRDMDYDGYEEHKRDHEMLLDEIRDIMDAYEQDAYFDYEDALASHLRDWFTVHSKTRDARFHKWLTAQGRDFGRG